MQGKSASIARSWLMILAACGLTGAACSGKVGSNGETGSGGATGPSGGATGAAGTTGAAGKSGGAAGTSGGAMVNPPPGQSFFVGANFWNIDWEGQNDYFQSGVN